MRSVEERMRAKLRARSGAAATRSDRDRPPMRRILVVVSCLTIGGCAGINLSGSKPDYKPDYAASQPPSEPQPPEGKKLVDFVNAAFATAKLSGTPEFSPVRATHDNQLGDFTFCVKAADPSPKYAVLIGHDAVLEVRSSVFIDGCEGQTYQPLPPPEPPAKKGQRR
jgi:hypothetical protein